MRVGFDGVEGVDSDDGPVEPGGSEHGASGSDGGHDGVDAGSSTVDQLVADADSVDDVPAVLCRVRDVLYFLVDLSDVPDAEEDLHLLCLGGGEHVGHLLAVGAVDPDETVSLDRIEVGLDLLLSLAAVVLVVGSIRDPETTSGSLGHGKVWRRSDRRGLGRCLLGWDGRCLSGRRVDKVRCRCGRFWSRSDRIGVHDIGNGRLGSLLHRTSDRSVENVAVLVDEDDRLSRSTLVYNVGDDDFGAFWMDVAS